MILDNLIKAAFKVINMVAPFLTPQNFLDALREDFDPNLSDTENKERMMQKIREGKLGQALAEAASYESKTDKEFPELYAEAEALSQDSPKVINGGQEDDLDKQTGSQGGVAGVQTN